MDDIEYIKKDDALACIEGYRDRDGSIVSPDELPEYQRIERLPAADVRENRRGHWVKSEYFGGRGRLYRCDQCGNYLDFRGVNAGRGDANFCPNCGADMREEDDG